MRTGTQARTFVLLAVAATAAARGSLRSTLGCDDSSSSVIRAVKSLKKVQFRGVGTPNQGSSPTGSEHVPPADYAMYGSQQAAIVPPPEHCNKEANNFTTADFDDAWSYLSCVLMRLFENPSVADAFDRAIAGLQPLVSDAENPPSTYPNPWLGASPEDFHDFFHDYFTFLPAPEGDKGGLHFILKANYFVRGNPAAKMFLNTLRSRMLGSAEGDAAEYRTEVFDWLYVWLTAHGMFMDSLASLTDVSSWVAFVNREQKSVGANMSAYAGYDSEDGQGFGYKSFNQFFARTFVDLNQSRPVSQPDADMVVTAPGDVEINFIINRLTDEMRLPVKGDDLNIHELLGGSRFASRFVGGTAVSNVLMPYAYHNFHAPVDGRLVETADIPGYFFGIEDGERFFGNGNSGQGNSAFNTFSAFHRRIYVYETYGYGLVAQVAVGLADVSSICQSVMSTLQAPSGCEGSECSVKVSKGDRVGFFLYGGSLNILLFEPGVFSSMNVLMGNRIGSMKKRRVPRDLDTFFA